MQGMLQMQLTKSFAEAKERTGFSILSLIPLIHGHGNKPEDSFLHDAELLLGEALKNLTKVDMTININATMPPQTGLLVTQSSFAAHLHRGKAHCLPMTVLILLPFSSMPP